MGSLFRSFRRHLLRLWQSSNEKLGACTNSVHIRSAVNQFAREDSTKGDFVISLECVFLDNSIKQFLHVQRLVVSARVSLFATIRQIHRIILYNKALKRSPEASLIE